MESTADTCLRTYRSCKNPLVTISSGVLSAHWPCTAVPSLQHSSIEYRPKHVYSLCKKVNPCIMSRLVSYDTLWQWYVNACSSPAFSHPTNDVTVMILEREHTAFGHNKRTGSIDNPFLTRNMRAFKVNRDDSLSRFSRFANGLFVVVEEHVLVQPIQSQEETDSQRRRAFQKKNLFFVFPKRHGTQLFTADHFSFVLDNNDHTTPLHLHLTEYIPYPNETNPSHVSEGVPMRTNNYMQREFPLYDKPDDMVRNKIIRNHIAKWFHNEIHAILERPFVSHGGGTRRRWSSSAHPLMHENDQGKKEMARVWQKLVTVVEMRIIAIRNPPPRQHLSSVTVYIQSDVPLPPGHLGRVFSYCCDFETTLRHDSLLWSVARWVDSMYELQDFRV